LPNRKHHPQNSVIKGLYGRVAWYQNLKLQVMKPSSTNHEVLLFTGTRFSRKQLCEKDSHQPDNSLTGQLQRACWNGLIFDLLPDIIEASSPKNNCYTWEVKPAENFIDVKMGPASYAADYAMSVNPYCFLLEKNFN
jgi:hypothetical protein